MHYAIKEPYWKEDGISVDLSKCNDEEFTVECIYKTKEGNRYFDGVFKIKKHIAEMMKTVYVKNKPLKLITFDYLRSNYDKRKV